MLSNETIYERLCKLSINIFLRDFDSNVSQRLTAHATASTKSSQSSPLES